MNRILPLLLIASCTSGALAPEPGPVPVTEVPGSPEPEHPLANPVASRLEVLVPAEPVNDPHAVDDLERWPKNCEGVADSRDPDEGPPPKLRCTLSGDFDGDGKADRLVLVSDRESGAPGFAVHWGAGGHSVIGANRRVLFKGTADPNDHGDDMVIDTLDWLEAWSIAPRKSGKYHLKVLLRPVQFELPDAKGDAIRVSSSDAAILLYFDGTDWRNFDLGY